MTGHSLISERNQLDQSSCDELDYMFSDMMEMCYVRRMALLTDGRVAVLPAAAKPGDQVAALYDGNSIYLVRHLPNRQAAYNCTGECYVDGLMDEALLEYTDKQTNQQDS